jgi:hypothetical protein
MPDSPSDSALGSDAFENATTALSTTYKVLGELDAPDGTGVLGHNTATSGQAHAIEGVTDSHGDRAAGVFGEATPSSGWTFGVHGVTHSSHGSAVGVRGLAPQGEADGVVGIAQNGGIGIGGTTDSTSQPAGVAHNLATTGAAIGHHGVVDSSGDGSVGVLGEATESSGQTFGIRGVTASPDGYGLGTPDDAKVGGTMTTDGAWQVIANGNEVLTLNPESLGNAGNVVHGHSTNGAFEGAQAVTIGGGGYDSGSGDRATNEVYDHFGTVAGGEGNVAGDLDGDPAAQPHATVGGGLNNTASGLRATVSGGSDNIASCVRGTIGGGDENTASGFAATVGGGQGNTASNPDATVSGGQANTASDSDATVGGGESNTASGFAATVPGGGGNTAAGEYSFAAGRNASADHDGSFVVGDGTDSAVSSGGQNELRFQQDSLFVGEGGLPTGTGASLVYDTGSGEVRVDTSSARYKSNIGPMETDPDAVLELEPRQFEHTESDRSDVGLIAEEVDEHLPELVVTDDEGRPDAVRYDRLGVYLLPVLEETRQENERLRDEIEQLRERVDELVASRPAPADD